MDGIPEFIFCGNCHSPRDVSQEDFIMVEKCEHCGDDEYLLFGTPETEERVLRDGL